MSIHDPHVSSVWVEIEIDAAGHKTILIAETGLQLDQQETRLRRGEGPTPNRGICSVTGSLTLTGDGRGRGWRA
jgi:hypothetical protein